MKTKIVISVALFAVSIVCEGIATRLMPFGELAKIAANAAKKA